MTKFLDTYETWEKIFKIARTEDDSFVLYIHENMNTDKKPTVARFNQEELDEFADFIKDFLK